MEYIIRRIIDRAIQNALEEARAIEVPCGALSQSLISSMCEFCGAREAQAVCIERGRWQDPDVVPNACGLCQWRIDCPKCMGGRIGPYIGNCERCDGRGWVWRVATDDIEAGVIIPDYVQAGSMTGCPSCGDILPDNAQFCI